MNHPSVTESRPTRSPGGTGIWCCEFELSRAGTLNAVADPADAAVMRVLVRLHGEPLGYLTLPFTSHEPGPAIVSASWPEFGDLITDHLRADGVEVPVGAARTGWRPPAATAECRNTIQGDEFVTVVVCTRDRAAALAPCLERLTMIRYPHVEFVIVDNAPADDATEQVIRAWAANDGRFRYVREPIAGLSRARNAGLAAARGDIVAYTDDDVAVDARWIEGLLRGFRTRADVTCVTGLVCTAAIRNSAEAYFDARTASWSSRCAPELFDLSAASRRGPLYPFSAGIFGTGASFAFRRARLTKLGGFDEALGAGAATRGGEDLDVFVRVLLAGDAIAYQPAAVVWHHHRADDAALLRQVYGYGTGLAAYLTKLLLHRSTRALVLRRIPAGIVRIARIRSATRNRLPGTVTPPAGALAREFAGYLAGPWLYSRARRAAGRAPSTRRSPS